MATNGIKKLQEDLNILVEMAQRIADYLRSDILFGKMPGKMPALTLGGYLMRQHRLDELRGLLTAEEVGRLEQAKTQYQQVMESNIVRSEERAQREFGARLQQWQEYIRDLRRDTKANFYYYKTAVEPRVMMEELLKMLLAYPYRLDEQLPERLKTLDGAVHNIWDHGDFVWPDEWQDAYPADQYWYLYGQPIALRLHQ